MTLVVGLDRILQDYVYNHFQNLMFAFFEAKEKVEWKSHSHGIVDGAHRHFAKDEVKSWHCSGEVLGTIFVVYNISSKRSWYGAIRKLERAQNIREHSKFCGKKSIFETTFGPCEEYKRFKIEGKFYFATENVAAYDG